MFNLISNKMKAENLQLSDEMIEMVNKYLPELVYKHLLNDCFHNDGSFLAIQQNENNFKRYKNRPTIETNKN